MSKGLKALMRAARLLADSDPEIFAFMVEHFERKRDALLKSKKNQKDTKRLYEVNLIIRHIKHEDDHELSFEEIGEMIGCKRSAPQMLHDKGIRNLMAMLKKDIGLFNEGRA
jgi:hypothetical protein